MLLALDRGDARAAVGLGPEVADIARSLEGDGPELVFVEALERVAAGDADGVDRRLVRLTPGEAALWPGAVGNSLRLRSRAALALALAGGGDRDAARQVLLDGLAGADLAALNAAARLRVQGACTPVGVPLPEALVGPW